MVYGLLGEFDKGIGMVKGCMLFLNPRDGSLFSSESLAWQMEERGTPYYRFLFNGTEYPYSYGSCYNKDAGYFICNGEHVRISVVGVCMTIGGSSFMCSEMAGAEIVDVVNIGYFDKESLWLFIILMSDNTAHTAFLQEDDCVCVGVRTVYHNAVLNCELGSDYLAKKKMLFGCDKVGVMY